MRLVRLVAIGAVCLAAVATSATLADLPWSTWFEKNTTVSDKGTYVHILWDAYAVRSRFEDKDKRAFIAEAARQLALLRYPKTASAEQMRVDIVFVTERDEYGSPKWDTLQRVAHLEFPRALVSQPAGPDPEKGFTKFEVFR